MTKDELFEMFDRYDAYETLETGETVQVIHWHDLNHLADEIVKLCSMPDVVERSPIKMEVDFNGHAKFEIETTDFDMKFIRGVNGWGEAIPCNIVHKNKL